MGRMRVGAFGPSGKVFHARLVAEDTRNHAPPLMAKATSSGLRRVSDLEKTLLLTTSSSSHHLVRIRAKVLKFELPLARLLIALKIDLAR